MMFLYSHYSLGELKEVFKGMGVPISESALSDILDRFDDNGDGLIDFAADPKVVSGARDQRRQDFRPAIVNDKDDKDDKDGKDDNDERRIRNLNQGSRATCG